MSIDSRSHAGRKHLATLRETALFLLAITEQHETTQQVAHALYISHEQRGINRAEELRALTVSCNQAVYAFTHLVDQYRLRLEDDRAPKEQLQAESLLEECSYIGEQTWSLT